MEVDYPQNEANVSQEAPMATIETPLSEVFEDKEMDVKCTEPIQLIRKAKISKRKKRNAKKIALAQDSRPQQNQQGSSLSKVQKFLTYISQEYKKGTIKIYPSAIGKAEKISALSNLSLKSIIFKNIFFQLFMRKFTESFRKESNYKPDACKTVRF
jgi:hypothetical protein